jgi:hypothetical protein
MAVVEPTVTETEDEAEIIARWLIAERVGQSKPVLAVHEVALLRKVAYLLASDGAGDAKDIATLLDLAPKIINPGAKPQPSLTELCKPGREWDLERLSTEQLLVLEDICEVAQGRACVVKSERMEACQRLALCLDGADAPAIEHVRGLLTDILPPAFALDVLHPSYQDDLMAECGRRVALEHEVARLEHQVAQASKPSLKNVASLAMARAEREAGW